MKKNTIDNESLFALLSRTNHNPVPNRHPDWTHETFTRVYWLWAARLIEEEHLHGWFYAASGWGGLWDMKRLRGR